jgi:polygalacturonase
VFDVVAGDFSTELTADTENGIYIGMADDPNATTKVAKRRIVYGISVLWFGATGDGVTDDTAAIQAALGMGGKIVIPKPSVKYKTDTLAIPSNIDIDIENGTIIEANSGFAEQEELINIIDVSNVVIRGYGAVCQMLKAEYTTGEFRHGVNIRGATNVNIEGLSSNDSGGDGFYIGTTPNQPYCQNVVLRDVSADNNRRQGLSVTSVKGLRVLSSRFTNTTGTNPSAGIDLEPNSNTAFMEDVVLENPYTEGNDGSAIVVSISSLVGAIDTNVAITIINPVDKQSNIGLSIEGLDIGANVMSGYIKVINPVSIEPDSGAVWVRNYDALGPEIRIDNPKAIRPNEDNYTSPKYGSAFLVFRETTDTGATTLGNVHFTNPVIEDDRDVPQVVTYFHIKDEASGLMTNVTIDGDIVGTGIDNGTDMVDFYGSGRVEDKSRLLEYDATGSFDQDTYNYVRYVTNASATKTIFVTLAAIDHIGWPLITYEVRSDNLLRLVPDVSSHIYPGSNGAGKYIESSQIGAKLTLRRFSSTVWIIEEEIGTWTRQV